MKLLSKRILVPPNHSFFLFGPRSVGKSFWLKRQLAKALSFDLLEHKTYLELSRDPGILEARIGDQPPGTWICLDEIQKIPTLLDEVHRLIENREYRFALSGSSARKLKRGGANLLAGRAITKKMEGFCFAEMEDSFDLKKILQWGSLPLIVTNPTQAQDILNAYIHTYVKEEIREEGLVRAVEPFVRFLQVAGLMNGQQLNRENVARDAHVPRSTVDVYFSILEDTLLGHFLPTYQPQAKVREQSHPKFYWFDVGVARGAAGLLFDAPDPLWLGNSLETFIFHELRVYNHVYSKNRMISFYRSGAGSEIDFVIETKKRTMQSKPHLICLEVKHATRWKREWEAPMRSLSSSEKVAVDSMYGIYVGQEEYHFDGLNVLPVEVFLKKLYQGKIF